MAKGNETLRPIGTFASVFLDPDGDQDQSDFRQVPKTDRGNAGYSDMGQRGSYAPHNRDQFADPEGLKRFAGYGADVAALSQGYVTCSPNEDPAYDKINYESRSTQPKNVNEDFENTDMMPTDYEFRGRNRKSRGFLTRPHLPTER
jgi:hypothetical protein